MQVQNNSTDEILVAPDIALAYRLLKIYQQQIIDRDGLVIDPKTALPQEIEHLKVALANYEKVASKLKNTQERTVEWFQLQQAIQQLEKNIEALKQQVLLLGKQ